MEFTDEISDRGYGLVTHFKMPRDFEVELYQPHYSTRPSRTTQLFAADASDQIPTAQRQGLSAERYAVRAQRLLTGRVNRFR